MSTIMYKLLIYKQKYNISILFIHLFTWTNERINELMNEKEIGLNVMKNYI